MSPCILQFYPGVYLGGNPVYDPPGKGWKPFIWTRDPHKVCRFESVSEAVRIFGANSALQVTVVDAALCPKEP